MKTESPCSIASPCMLDKSSRKRPVSDLVTPVEERGNFQILNDYDRNDVRLEATSVRLQPTTICNIQSVAGISVMGSSPLNVNKPNQDALIMFEDEKTQSLVIACLDGHGVNGHLIAQFFKREITARLPIHPLFASNLEVTISEVLFVLEYELYRKEQRIADFSGTTLTLAVIRNGKVTVANIGDSRIILARHVSHCQNEGMSSSNNSMDSEEDEAEPSSKRICRELSAKPLTVDHKPDCPLEYQRILSTGGRVFSVRYEDGCVGPARVWLGNMNVPGLAMSRSLGDFIVHTAGVISKPDYAEYTLQPDEDVFLIAATDGLFDHISNHDAMNIVAGIDNGGAVEAVQLLWKESRSRWLSKERVIDDTTICVVHFQRQQPTSPINPQE
jgi:serine/threonine protein phosphatase PrpC